MIPAKYSYEFVELKISKDGTGAPKIGICTKGISNPLFELQRNSKH